MPQPDRDTSGEIAMTSPDSARGIVRRVGADPLSRLALLAVPPRTVPPLALTGALSTELQAAEGLEITVAGRMTAEISRDVSPGGARVFVAQSYRVHAADGVEAHDGVLASENGRWFLEVSPSTRVAIIEMPSALTSHLGARVFLVGPLTKAPQAFGVLRAK